MKKMIRQLSAVIGIGAFLLLGAGFVMAAELPDSFSVAEGQKLTFPQNLSVSARASDSVPAQCSSGFRYSCDLKLFGAVQVKKASVNVVSQKYVIPGGGIFGVKLYTEGVMVIGLSDVDTANGPQNPSYNAGIRKGDIILAVNGRPVNSNDEIAQAFTQSGGGQITISVRRGSTGFEARVKPALSVSEKAYKAGIWVRDSTAGIGTITYYDPSNGAFGGLGHGICDVDTGEILPLLKGEAVVADLSGILKSTSGRTGELEGILEDTMLGTLQINRQTGVFGYLYNNIPNRKEVPVAMCQQVHTGDATILSTVDSNGPREYKIRIESVNYDDSTPTKNMVIKVTDSALISKTGGIVQGMSGSPILQDGRLVGAVTHVFVSDPVKGYGIFAENMVKTADLLTSQQQKAS